MLTLMLTNQYVKLDWSQPYGVCTHDVFTVRGVPQKPRIVLISCTGDSNKGEMGKKTNIMQTSYASLGNEKLNWLTSMLLQS